MFEGRRRQRALSWVWVYHVLFGTKPADTDAEHDSVASQSADGSPADPEEE
jgi:hypothetical protein